MTKVIVVALLLSLYAIDLLYAVPQQIQNTNSEIDRSVEQAIRDTFGTFETSSKRPIPTSVVTPDPNYVPTSSPQHLIVNDQNCTCVPYHKCDPRTNTVKNNDPINTDEITGFGDIDIRFDAHDCQEILDVCCVGVSISDESLTPKPMVNVPTKEAGCGVRNVGGLDFKLTGAFDNEAGFGEFPWTVAIIRIDNDTCICGGSLIHPKAILTGAHCVKDYIYKAKDLKIRAGEWDTATVKERLPHQERIVSRIFSHPNYQEKGLANNFAIIELEDPFQMDSHISTVCLPPSSFVPNQRDCFASGWGKDVFGQAGKYSAIMKRVPLPIVEFSSCQRALQTARLGPNFRLDQSFICAGGVEGIDTCQGDGGAPLVCPIGRPSDNRYAQNGIVSWGLGCKNAVPAVYANVATARDWIDGTIRLLGLDTSYYTFRG